MPVAEKALIAEIRRLVAQQQISKPTSKIPRIARLSQSILTGIGDDCAVLRLAGSTGKNQDTLITTDFTLEGIHFRRDWHSPESVGHRCLARGLSDIAAMGGEPVAAFLSLALPHDLPQSWTGRFLRSLIGLAEEHSVTLAGGDTAESPRGILADIIVVGAVPKGKGILRSGAKPEDHIYVSGELGGSAAAILELNKHELKKREKRKTKSGVNPREYPRHFFPDARLELGRILRERGLASAMIDTSDGLSTDLAHICEESGVGAEIAAGMVPRASVGKPPREVDLDVALHGGEDYELLFTARPKLRVPTRIGGVPVTRIGTVTRDREIVVRSADGVAYQLHARGWEHFRK